MQTGGAVGDTPRHRSACPGHPSAGVCWVLVRACGTRGGSSQPGPAPAAGAFGTLSLSVRVQAAQRAAGSSGQQQQKSVVERSVVHVSQMMGKFLLFLSLPCLPSPSHFLSLNIFWLHTVEEVTQVVPQLAGGTLLHYVWHHPREPQQRHSQMPRLKSKITAQTLPFA